MRGLSGPYGCDCETEAPENVIQDHLPHLSEANMSNELRKGFNEKVENALDEHWDVKDAASDIYSRLTKREKEWAARQHCSRAFQEAHSRHRKPVQDEFIESHKGQDATLDERVTARRRMSRERVFNMETGEAVKFGDMTITDHEAKAVWYENMAAGAQQSAEMHRIAIGILRDEDTDTLNNLGVTQDQVEELVAN